MSSKVVLNSEDIFNEPVAKVVHMTTATQLFQRDIFALIAVYALAGADPAGHTTDGVTYEHVVEDAGGDITISVQWKAKKGTIQ